MLIEIIIYIGLFSALFSGAFISAFQTIDAVRYLQVQKERVDSTYFLNRQLSNFVKNTSDWSDITETSVNGFLAVFNNLQVSFVSAQISDTATSTSRILLLVLEINKKNYTFSYVQEK